MTSTTTLCNCTGPQMMCAMCIDTKKAPNPIIQRLGIGAATAVAVANVESAFGTGTTTVRTKPTGFVKPDTDRTKPTDAQVEYLRSLLATKTDVEGIRAQLNEARIAGTLDRRMVSKAIDTLRNRPNAPTDRQVIDRDNPAAPPARTENTGSDRSTTVAEGFYEHNGTVYKVQRAVHGSGNLYGKILNPATGTFAYKAGVPALLNRVSAKPLTLDRAKELGRLYGVCCRCARTLTKESSIAQGMGDHCASKF